MLSSSCWLRGVSHDVTNGALGESSGNGVKRKSTKSAACTCRPGENGHDDRCWVLLPNRSNYTTGIENTLCVGYYDVHMRRTRISKADS